MAWVGRAVPTVNWLMLRMVSYISNEVQNGERTWMIQGDQPTRVEAALSLGVDNI